MLTYDKISKVKIKNGGAFVLFISVSFCIPSEASADVAAVFGGGMYDHSYSFNNEIAGLSDADYWITPDREIQYVEPGGVNLYKGFTQSTSYESNFFRTSNDNKPEMTAAYAFFAGVKQGRPDVSRQHSDLSYSLSYVDHVQYDKFSRLGHLIAYRYGIETQKLRFTIEDSFRPDSSVPVSDRTDLRASLGSRAVQYTNQLSAALTYEWSPKLTLRNTYRHNFVYIPASSNEGAVLPERQSSYQLHTYTSEWLYQISPKTKLVFKYILENSDYFRGGDNAHDGQTLRAGAAWQATPRLRLYGDGGYHFLDFKQPLKNDSSGIVYTLNADYEVAPRLVVSGSFAQTQGRNSASSDDKPIVPEIDHYRIGSRWALSERMEIAANIAYSHSHKAGSATRPDPADPGRTVTALDETDVLSYTARWTWQPGTGWAAAVNYLYQDTTSTFASQENATYQISGSLLLAL